MSPYVAALAVTYWLAHFSVFMTIPSWMPVSYSALILGVWCAVLLYERRLIPPTITVAALCAYFALRLAFVDMVAVYLLYASFNTRRELISLQGALLAVTSLMSLLALEHVLTVGDSPYINVLRFKGLSGDPNDTAAMLIAGTSVAAFWALHRTHWAAVIAAAGALAVVQTNSRAGAIALVITALVVAVQAAHSRRHVLIVTAGTVLALVLGTEQFWHRMFTLLDGSDLGHRFELATTGWELFRDNPLMGIGVGEFSRHSGGYSPHSELVAAFAEGGLLTGSIFVFAVVAVLKDVRSAFARFPGLSLAVALSLLLAFVGSFDTRSLAVLLTIAPLTVRVGADKTPS